MKVSIITTIYKAEKELPRLLDSMMAQKSPELEFFLIDNGSPDRCGDICKEYAKKDSRFVVYSIKDNIGYIGARNRGLSIVDCDYVGFCDSDDFLEPGGYDKAIQKIHETDCDLYITSYRTKTENDEGFVTNMPYDTGLYKDGDIADKILPAAFGPSTEQASLHGFMWKQVFRRRIITDNRLTFNETLKPYEDQLFNIQVIKRCNKVYVDDNVIYNYIINPESITAKNAQNFDPEAEYKRITLLYQEELKYIQSRIEEERLSNNVLFALYSLFLSTAKLKSKTLSELADLLNKTLTRNFVSKVCAVSRGFNGFRYIVTKHLLKLGLYRLLLTIFRGILILR